MEIFIVGDSSDLYVEQTETLSAVFAVSMSSQFYSAQLIYFYLAFQKQEHLSVLSALHCNRFG